MSCGNDYATDDRSQAHSVYVHVHVCVSAPESHTGTGETFMRADDEHSLSCRTNFLFIPLEINPSSYQHSTTSSREDIKEARPIDFFDSFI